MNKIRLLSPLVYLNFSTPIGDYVIKNRSVCSLIAYQRVEVATVDPRGSSYIHLSTILQVSAIGSKPDEGIGLTV